MLKYLTYCVSYDYPPICARPVYSRRIEKERKKGRFVRTSRRRRHPINRSFYQDWHFLCPVERRVLCRRTPSQPIKTKKAGKQAAVCSGSGALPAPKPTEKKNHTTTQILPMEKGQDVEACSANEKIVCKLAT